jgi:Cu(I)/Ag(I) efflux system membrane fusion protein
MVEESGAKRRLLLSRTYAEGLVRVQAPEALAVPRAAVLSPTHLPVVYVEKARGVYEQRLVKLGRTGDQCVEVLEGVSEGERVVIEGNLLVDAQAQLARGAVGAGPTASAAGSQPGEDQTVTAQKLPALAEAQKQRLRELFVWAGALASGLAQDNLAEYNQQAAQAPQVVAAASQTLAGTAELSALMEKVAAEGRLSAASDLVAARKAFLPLSGAVVELAKATRVAAAEFRDLKLYKCPMVSQAWPGAPKDGFWVQLQGPVRNPYFGAEMLECGVELKP